LLEIAGEEVREWAVSRIEDKHILLGQYAATAVQISPNRD